jgi:hypothetical protein
MQERWTRHRVGAHCDNRHTKSVKPLQSRQISSSIMMAITGDTAKVSLSWRLNGMI